jgi:hypothetical protein
MPPRDAASLANADGASVGRRADAAPAGVALATADGAYAGRSVDASDASASRHRGMRWPPHGISHEEESGSSSRVRDGEEICGIETGKRLWIEERDTKDLSALLAPGRPIRALASDTSVTVGWGSNQSLAVRFKAREQMLRACCEPLRAMLRAGCVQHPNISRLPPTSSHVATMLRLCCHHVATCAACNIQHQELSSSSPPHKTQYYMSATLKLNIRNIKI